jgi:hypothetical protein
MGGTMSGRGISRAIKKATAIWINAKRGGWTLTLASVLFCPGLLLTYLMPPSCKGEMQIGLCFELKHRDLVKGTGILRTVE